MKPNVKAKRLQIGGHTDERLVAHAEANSARRRGQANSVTNENSEEDGEDYAKVFAAFIAFQNKAKAKLPAPAGWFPAGFLLPVAKGPTRETTSAIAPG